MALLRLARDVRPETSSSTMLLAATALLLALLPRGGGELNQALWSSVVTLEMEEVRRGADA